MMRNPVRHVLIVQLLLYSVFVRQLIFNRRRSKEFQELIDNFLS
ncbi:hypothetical protein DERF_002011, partial [Dermatophagoides farinae]